MKEKRNSWGLTEKEMEQVHKDMRDLEIFNATRLLGNITPQQRREALESFGVLQPQPKSEPNKQMELDLEK